MESEWGKFKENVAGLQSELKKFGVDFLEREGFNKFTDTLYEVAAGYEEICITDYFSQTTRSQLERLIGQSTTKRVRLITQELDPPSKRDRKNLEALKKLCDAGAEVEVNNRLHARMFLAYRQSSTSELMGGLLIVGSFDFNSECIGLERYDGGIMTGHPDLVSSALRLLDQIWNQEESEDLVRKYGLSSQN